MPVLAKRALLAALTAIGLVLFVLGLWFTAHLGFSGTARFTANPAGGSVVVLEPSVLNRVDQPVTVTASAGDGSPVWAGLASPSDAAAIVGGAERTSVTSAHVSDWSLTTHRTGSGAAPALSAADVWQSTKAGTGAVRVTVHQSDAPQSLVIATADGAPAHLDSLTLSVHRSTWVFQSLLCALVGLIALVAGAAGLWQLRKRPARKTTAPETDQPAAQVAA